LLLKIGDAINLGLTLSLNCSYSRKPFLFPSLNDFAPLSFLLSSCRGFSSTLLSLSLQTGLFCSQLFSRTVSLGCLCGLLLLSHLCSNLF
jgi:hypothetical protein